MNVGRFILSALLNVEMFS